MEVVRQAHFRPEFLNRLDEIILFHRLQPGADGRDRRYPAGRLRSCWPSARSSLELDEDAVDWLADKGYDPVYGARPLKRVIQRELQDPLAEALGVLAPTVPRMANF
jgi:ATP-dependent Clp protease ATP-binding subunit ClpB